MFSELQIFIYSCIFGSFLSLVYDLFRILRLFMCKFWSVFIQDMIYFLISGVGTFLFILYFNFGEIRFYILVGEIIGWLIYYLTFGSLFYKHFSKIAKLMKKTSLSIYGKAYNLWEGILKKFKLISIKKT